MSTPQRIVGVVWFRRDLRLADNLTLRRALDECDEVIPLFVVDDRFWTAAGANRRWFLAGCLADLDDQLDGRLIVRHDDPVSALVDLVDRHGVSRLYRAADAGPAGRRRDAEVDDALREQVVTPSSSISRTPSHSDGYERRPAIPSRCSLPTGVGGAQLPVEAPQQRPTVTRFATGVHSDAIPHPVTPTASEWQPEPGERAAHAALDRFLHTGVGDYAQRRDVPAADATSRLGPYLKFGCLHPRQLLHRLDLDDPEHEMFARQLAWRDFYADVLYAWPDSAWQAFNPALADIPVDTGTARRRALRGLVRRPHRLSDRRCRHAPARRRGVRPQPGADDRRQLPRQGSPPRLDSWCPPLPGPPLRR